MKLVVAIILVTHGMCGICHKDHVKILKELGVDDSKKLTDAKIVELAEQLVTFIPHSLLTLDNVKYNERQRAGWSQVK